MSDNERQVPCDKCKRPASALLPVRIFCWAKVVNGFREGERHPHGGTQLWCFRCCTLQAYVEAEKERAAAHPERKEP